MRGLLNIVVERHRPTLMITGVLRHNAVTGGDVVARGELTAGDTWRMQVRRRDVVAVMSQRQ